MARWSALIAALSVCHSATACSTDSFDPIYNVYPDCAAACMACGDPDYTNNFDHTYNYTSGDCCSSQHHTAIADTWACVLANCGAGDAQQAFDVFLKFCSDHQVPLAAADIPVGYNDTNGTQSGNAKPNSHAESWEADILRN